MAIMARVVCLEPFKNADGCQAEPGDYLSMDVKEAHQFVSRGVVCFSADFRADMLQKRKVKGKRSGTKAKPNHSTGARAG